jgi:hypothetical protein
MLPLQPVFKRHQNTLVAGACLVLALAWPVLAQAGESIWVHQLYAATNPGTNVLIVRTVANISPDFACCQPSSSTPATFYNQPQRKDEFANGYERGRYRPLASFCRLCIAAFIFSLFQALLVRERHRRWTRRLHWSRMLSRRGYARFFSGLGGPAQYHHRC